ncbi:hypothetical protein [Massilia sp. 9096]|uniref:hypothetical protein n=1 Tax=Massilia sp. 9096 TaxID=1500894 RepID=UPI000B0E5B87|nr:hypothetical protein [Massilia sp. 9096]
MRYEISKESITFFLNNPKREAESNVNFSTAEINLTEATLDCICGAITRQALGHQPTTQRNYLSHVLRPLLTYFRTAGTTFPRTSNEWQLYLLCFFQYYLIDTSWSMASVTTRMRYWSTLVSGVFEFWMLDELIPCDVKIPSARLKRIQSAAGSERLLGERTMTTAPVGTPPQKLLASIEFASPAAEYLDTIERACREKVRVIQQTCQAHWDALMSDGRSGAELRSTVHTDEFKEAVQTGVRSQQLRGGSPTLLASNAHPRGHAWALAVTQSLLLSGANQDCVSIQSLLDSKFFAQRTFDKGGFGALAHHTAMPSHAFDQLTGKGQFYRFAGILSSLDAAAACCLLTIEHPEFTSDALQSARLLNSRGKSHLLITDNAQSSILSLDKPRAGRRKSVALTPVAQQLMMDILAWTAPVRKVLRRAGHKGWRYLFLGCGQGGKLGPLAPSARHLNSDSVGHSLIRLYPVLAEQGLTEGSFDYRRIRTTMGVLRWFESGSIQEMSRRLGNTTRVVLEHYLPPALLRAWNTRIIRRFQNTLIVLAAHGADYLLEVTDFKSVAALQHFIAQLVLEYPGNSTLLAKEVQTRLNLNGQLTDTSLKQPIGDSVLNIKLSSKGLSYLYAFSDFVVKNLTPAELVVVDSQTKLAPVQFVDLARLIRHACENDDIAASMRELLDLGRLRLMHERATTEQITLATKFSRFTLSKKWQS